MRFLIVLLCAVSAVASAQDVPPPPASFTGTVRHIDAGAITLARPDQDDLDISRTRRTRYFSGAKRIKREDIKQGDRVSVEATLDLLLKPAAVIVRRLPAEKP